MRFLRTNTAVRITIGPAIDKTDGLTPKDTLTVANLVGALCYDADDGDAVTVTHFHPAASGSDNDMVSCGYAGMWDLELTAANLNFTGRMMLAFTDKDQICPIFHEFQVLSANVYDSLFGGHGITADKLDVNTAEWLGTACHTATINGVPVVQLHTTGGGIDAPANFEDMSITDTTGLVSIGTGTGLSAIPWNSAWDAEVQSECQDAIVANNLDHLMKTPVSDITKLGDGGGNEVPDSTVLSLMLCKGTDTDTYNHTTDSLEAVRETIDTAVTQSTEANAHAHAVDLVTAKLDTALVLDGAVYQYTANALELAPTGGSAPTVAQIRAEMDSNSTQLSAIKTQTDKIGDATIGLANIKSLIDTIDGVADAILVDTGTTLDGKIDAIDTIVDAITAKTSSLTFTEAGKVDANVKSINSTALTGNGTTTPWGAA